MHPHLSGFQDGLLGALQTKANGLAESTAAVFGSASGAKQLLNAEIGAELKSQGARFTVAAIPGSVGLSGKLQAPLNGYLLSTNVWFSTGHCFIEVSVARYASKATSTPERDAIAGATALYRRAKRVCA